MFVTEHEPIAAWQAPSSHPNLNTERPFIPAPYSSQTLHRATAKCHHSVRTVINALGRQNSTASGNSRKPVLLLMTVLKCIVIKWLVSAVFRLKVISTVLQSVGVDLLVHLAGGMFGKRFSSFKCGSMSQLNRKWLVFGRTQRQKQPYFGHCTDSPVLEKTVLTFPQRGLCCNMRKRKERAPSMTTMTSSQTKHSLHCAHPLGGRPQGNGD